MNTYLKFFCALYYLIYVTFGLTNNEEQELIFKVFDFPKNETTKICIPYYLCESKRNDSVLIDVRSSFKECPNYFDVLCEVSYDYLIEKYMPSTSTPSNGIKPSSTECGKRNVNGIAFKIIENENEAQFGEFPWMVAILIDTWNPYLGNVKIQCDGILIHPQVVLTTAQCVHSSFSSNIKVRAGDWDTQTEKEPMPCQERDVDQIIFHEEFIQNVLLRNNIALLILKSPVNLDSHISTILLPKHINKLSMPKHNDTILSENCITTGWGSPIILDEDETRSKILKKFSTLVFNNKECKNKLLSSRLSKTFNTSSSVICTEGNTTNNMCLGAEGTILICPQSNGQYVLNGIRSPNAKCDEQEMRLFMDLSYFRNWIESKILNISLTLDGLCLDANNTGYTANANTIISVYFIFLVFYCLFK